MVTTRQGPVTRSNRLITPPLYQPSFTFGTRDPHRRVAVEPPSSPPPPTGRHSVPSPSPACAERLAPPLEITTSGPSRDAFDFDPLPLPLPKGYASKDPCTVIRTLPRGTRLTDITPSDHKRFLRGERTEKEIRFAKRDADEEVRRVPAYCGHCSSTSMTVVVSCRLIS